MLCLRCRSRWISDYFGQPDEPNCLSCCDVCLVQLHVIESYHEPRRIDDNYEGDEIR